MGKKPGKGIIIAIIIFLYITADVLMDIYLFPQLSEALKEHHKEIVGRNIIFFALIPVWIAGYIIFEKRHRLQFSLEALLLQQEYLLLHRSHLYGLPIHFRLWLLFSCFCTTMAFSSILLF